MYSKIKIAGHPLHPMLVGFPVAFYTASLVCYLYYNFHADPFWFKVAVISNGAGVVMALLAALPGFIDWLNIPKLKKAKKVGLNHMLCNGGALLFFALNLFLQCPKWNDIQPEASLAILLSSLGVLLTIIAGFLGWSLVQNHHVGITLSEQQQNVEPPSGVK